MTKELLASVDWSQFGSLKTKDCLPNTYYIVINKHDLNSDFINQLINISESFTSVSDWASIWDENYLAYPLLETITEIIEKLDEDQPTFNHKSCPNHGWVLPTEGYILNDPPEDSFHTLVCPECGTRLDGYQGIAEGFD